MADIDLDRLRRMVMSTNEAAQVADEINHLRARLAAVEAELAGATPPGVEWTYRPWVPRQDRTAEDWESMVAAARNRAFAAEDRLADVAAQNQRMRILLERYEPGQGWVDPLDDSEADRG